MTVDIEGQSYPDDDAEVSCWRVCCRSSRGGDMRQIIAFDHVSADGYFASEDGTLDWVVSDEELTRSNLQNMAEADTILFGRRTYEMFESFWPNAIRDPRGTADHAGCCWSRARVSKRNRVAAIQCRTLAFRFQRAAPDSIDPASTPWRDERANAAVPANYIVESDHLLRSCDGNPGVHRGAWEASPPGEARGEELATSPSMSSLRLVHPKRDASCAERLTELAGKPRQAEEMSSSSLRLHSMVEKLYQLDDDTKTLEVFEQVVDDLLAEARRDQ
jgi:RibD domain-containing protein